MPFVLAALTATAYGELAGSDASAAWIVANGMPTRCATRMKAIRRSVSRA